MISFSKTFSIQFLYKIYAGESELEDLESSDITSLRYSALKDNINGEYDMEAGDYKWFCYPTGYGQRTKFFDLNTGFDVEMDTYRIVELTNAYGVITNYYCYRTYYKLAGTITVGIRE